ncbi:MAG: hypothetical protein WCG80_15285 [Spirochaetales bacterium]
MADVAPEPPAYIRFDKKQREEFLSQYGVTAPTQRELFHQLCSTWRPLIDFDQFVAGRTAQFAHAGHEVENLVGRLKTARMAHFTYRKNDKGERVPKDIILCDEGAERYWFHFVQDLAQQACDNPRNPYLTVALLKSREILLPTSSIEEVALSRISKNSIEALAKTEKLLFLTLQTEQVLVTSQSLATLLTFSSAKLRFVLKNPEVTAAASRLLNLGLSDVTKRLDDKESGFWRGLTEALLLHRDDLLADRRLHLDVAFFQAAEMFFSYLTNQLDEIKKNKEEAQQREVDMREVERLVLHDKEVIMPPQELESHLSLLCKDKYGDRFEAFREDFMTQYTQTTQKVSIAPLVALKSGLVHRNNLYKEFLRRFESLRPLLIQDYLVKMDHRLRRPGNSGEISFLNLENLDRSLAEWTEKADPMVHELIGKPKLLAEALIHHGRTNLGLASVEDMKDLMVAFYKPGVMTFRRLQEIYGLDVSYLFENSFRRLSVFSQFWRRLTGRYRIQAEEFRALALPKEAKQGLPGVKRAGTGLAPTLDDDRSLENLSPEEKKKRRQEWRSRKQSDAASRTSAPKEPEKEKPVVAKQYNDKERETAWSSFKDTLKKD